MFYKVIGGGDGFQEDNAMTSQSPLVQKNSEINKRKHRAPQVQKTSKPSSYG